MPEVKELSLEEFNPKILRRYDAFRMGKNFNQRLLSLTSRRIEIDGIAQTSYFIPECNKDNTLSVSQKTIAGKPRLFIVGVGADTEEIVKGKISWKHSRLGKMGSSLKFEVMASYRRQQFTANSNWYILPEPSRWFLYPNFTFKRKYERKYEYVKAEGGILPSITLDNQHFKADLNLKGSIHTGEGVLLHGDTR